MKTNPEILPNISYKRQQLISSFQLTKIYLFNVCIQQRFEDLARAFLEISPGIFRIVGVMFYWIYSVVVNSTIYSLYIVAVKYFCCCFSIIFMHIIWISNFLHNLKLRTFFQTLIPPRRGWNGFDVNRNNFWNELLISSCNRLVFSAYLFWNWNNGSCSLFASLGHYLSWWLLLFGSSYTLSSFRLLLIAWDSRKFDIEYLAIVSRFFSHFLKMILFACFCIWLVV